MSTEALHAYNESLSAGPCPAHPDPYAEAGQWFHQIHVVQSAISLAHSTLISTLRV